MSEDEANVSPYEVDDVVSPHKRLRGLVGSSRDERLVVHAAERKRAHDGTLLRESRPRVKRQRALRPLRSDASVELGSTPTAPIGDALRSRLVASWQVSSHNRHLDDVGLLHWRSGQAEVSSDTSEFSP